MIIFKESIIVNLNNRGGCVLEFPAKDPIPAFHIWYTAGGRYRLYVEGFHGLETTILNAENKWVPGKSHAVLERTFNCPSEAYIAMQEFNEGP